MLDAFGFKQALELDSFIRLAMRLGLDLAIAWTVIWGIHYRLYRNRDMAFTCLLFNVITFALCFLLRGIPIEMGFALGLFAVFGILRYRTEAIRTRDLTYLFVVIGLAILNAVANKKVSFAEVMLIDLVIVGLTWLIGASPFSRREESHNVFYDNLELLQPDRRAALIEDLSKRTGLEVIWVDVGDIDLLRDTAELTISCRSQNGRHRACFESPGEPEGAPTTTPTES